MGTLVGELAFYVTNTIILTLGIAAYVLWRYRAAVLHGMQAAGAVSLPIPNHALLKAIQPDSLHQTHWVTVARAWEKRARRQIVVAYLLSVAIPALMLAAMYLKQWDIEVVKIPAVLTLILTWMLAPVVPMITVTLAMPLLHALGWWMALLFTGALMTVLVSMLQKLAIGRLPSTDQLMNFLSFFQIGFGRLPSTDQLMNFYSVFQIGSTPGWLLLLLFFLVGNLRLRGVAPITFVGLLVFGFAPFAGLHLVRAFAEANQSILPFNFPNAWFNAWLAERGGFLLLALPTGAIAWWCLRSLARTYQVKRLSDAQLLASSLWLIFAGWQGLVLAASEPKPWLWLAGGAVAGLMFPPLNRFFLMRAELDRERPSPRTLLLLRVFGNRRRTERLFDRVAARWRLFGPVTMIAAPDVIARIIDAGDFLRFATGRTADIFVKSQADLDARLASLDLAPDPDGRYRINDFCCDDTTWQATVIELMLRADAVIMDVRGLTTERRGCEFELQQLATRLPAQKVVLIVDHTTDREIIGRATGNRWEGVRLITVERNATRETECVFEELLAAAD